MFQRIDLNRSRILPTFRLSHGSQCEWIGHISLCGMGHGICPHDTHTFHHTQDLLEMLYDRRIVKFYCQCCHIFVILAT